MFIHNTTFHLTGDRTISAFLSFMRDEYLPTLQKDVPCTEYRFVRLLTDLGDDVIGYALLIDAADLNALRHLKQEVLPPLAQTLHTRFGEKVLSFATSMKTVAFQP